MVRVLLGAGAGAEVVDDEGGTLIVEWWSVNVGLDVGYVMW